VLAKVNLEEVRTRERVVEVIGGDGSDRVAGRAGVLQILPDECLGVAGSRRRLPGGPQHADQGQEKRPSCDHGFPPSMVDESLTAGSPPNTPLRVTSPSPPALPV